MRHLVHQGLGETQVLTATRGALLASEGDLGGDASTLVGRPQAMRSALGAHRLVEGVGEARLRGSRRGLERLERSDPLDDLRRHRRCTVAAGRADNGR